MTQQFVTCDLLDDHPTSQVYQPYSDGKVLKNYGGVSAFYGQVVTVKCHEDNSRVKEVLATNGHGKVLVVDGGGSMRCALMGDIIAQSAVDNGWVAVIIYGCIRDVDVIASLPLGVQALASIPQKSNRQGVGELNVPISFGGLNIKPDQYIYADNNGVIVSDTALI